MLRPRFYLAPDDGAGTGAPSADTDPSEGQSTETPPVPDANGTEPANTGAPGTAPGDTGQDANNGAGSAPNLDDAPVDLESIKRSLQGVSRERSQFKAEADDFKAKYEAAQAELERLKDRPYTPPASADVPPPSQDNGDLRDAKEINPMLEGLKFDPSDGLVWIDGAWQSPKAAMSIRFMESQIAAQQEASQRAEAQKKQEAAQQVISSAQSTIASECAKRFSGVSESAMQMITPSVMAAVGAELAKKGIDLADPARLPEDFPQVFGSAVAAAIKSAKAALADLQKPQALANAKAAEQQPVGGGGRAAAPGVESFENLSPSEQHKATVSMVDKLKAKFFG
jgi:hypothetical protein